MEMEIDKTRIRQIVLDAIEEHDRQLPADRRLDLKRDDEVLFGRGGKLDSLGLVNLVFTLEQGLQDELDAPVSLVSEKAMARSSSPFKTLEALVEFIAELLEDGE